MRQILGKKTKCEWTAREEEDLKEMEKLVTEIQCLAKFARQRDNIVPTNANGSRLGKRPRQKQNHNAVRQKQVANRYLTDIDKETTGRDAILALLLKRSA